MGKGGKLEEPSTPAGDRTQIPTNIQADERFAPFLGEGFNAAEFASSALAQTHSTVQEEIDTLQNGIAVLDRHLRQEVLAHQDDLIARTAKLNETDVALQRLTLSVRSIQRVATRVRSEVNEPYQHIAAKTRQLKNLQACVDTMRHAIHRYKLVQRLRTQMETTNTGILELAKAARLISDIAAVDTEVDLSGITIVDSDTDFIATSTVTVRAQIHAALRAGLDSLSQADVGSALQALYNLQELRSAVEEAVDAAAAAAERAIVSALDPRKLTSTSGASAGVLQGAAARVQDAVWERLNSGLDIVRKSAMEAWHLQRVLLKKRDPLTHVLFIDVVAPGPQDETPLDRFWAKTVEKLGAAFSAAYTTQRGSLVRDALLGSYPRLTGLLRALCGRLRQDTAAARDAGPAAPEEWEEILLTAPADLKMAYLATCQCRMAEAASAAFPGGSRALPTAADLQKFIARVHEELVTAANEGGERLSGEVAVAAGQALLLAAERAELMAAGGPELRAVGGACTPAQSRNIALCNALQEVDRSVAGLLPRLPDHAAAELSPALDVIEATALDLIAPTFKAMADALQEALMRLHALNLSADDGAEGQVVETSPYIRDVARLLSLFRIEIVSKLNPSVQSPTPSVGRALVERLTGRVLVFFVRHAALVRPLSRPGKLQLAKDAAELESTVGQSLLSVEQAGAPLRALRAFRRLLFTETADISVTSSLLTELPRSTVAHHLFSRTPSTFESPHVRNKLSPVQYSLWLDEHSEEDALKLIKTAVESGVGKAAAGQPGMQEIQTLLLTLVSSS